MKVLVLSLLRIGDFFQQADSLRQIQKNRNMELHIVLNEGFEQAQVLFPEFQFHFFPRQILQNLLVNPNASVLTAIQKLNEFIIKINQHQFDEVQNWSHTLVAARIMDLLECKEKKGIQFCNGKSLPLDSWQRYLNQNWFDDKDPDFHFVDAMRRANGFFDPLELKKFKNRQGPVYLQIFTSDSKKDWSQESWLELATDLSKIFSRTKQNYSIRILCTEKELEKLDSRFYVFPIDVLNFFELREKLKQASLVISADTSVLHLAALTSTRILGLYLGSANLHKTGPRQEGATLMTSQLSCSPCLHSAKCFQPSHLCSEIMTTTSVFKQALQLLNIRPEKDIEKIIEPEAVKSFQVQSDQFGNYKVKSISKQKNFQHEENFDTIENER